MFAFIGGDSSESDVSDHSSSEEEEEHLEEKIDELQNNILPPVTSSYDIEFIEEEEVYRLPEDIRSLEVGAIGSDLKSDDLTHEVPSKKNDKWTALERRLILCQGDEGVLRGEYASVLVKDDELFRILETNSQKSSSSSIEDLAQVIATRLNEENTRKVLIAAIGSLHAFIQSNWTGPRLDENMNEIRPVTTIKATDSETQSTVHISESSLSSTTTTTKSTAKPSPPTTITAQH